MPLLELILEKICDVVGLQIFSRINSNKGILLELILEKICDVVGLQNETLIYFVPPR